MEIFVATIFFVMIITRVPLEPGEFQQHLRIFLDKIDSTVPDHCYDKHFPDPRQPAWLEAVLSISSTTKIEEAEHQQHNVEIKQLNF